MVKVGDKVKILSVDGSGLDSSYVGTVQTVIKAMELCLGEFWVFVSPSNWLPYGQYTLVTTATTPAIAPTPKLKFKYADRVCLNVSRLFTAFARYQKGELGTVIQKSSLYPGYYWEVQMDSAAVIEVLGEHQIDLHQPTPAIAAAPKFKPGDKVRCITPCGGGAYIKGEIYEVKEYDQKSDHIVTVLDSVGRPDNGWYGVNFDLVSASLSIDTAAPLYPPKLIEPCEIVTTMANWKEYQYCRTHKVEPKDCPKC